MNYALANYAADHDLYDPLPMFDAAVEHEFAELQQLLASLREMPVPVERASAATVAMDDEDAFLSRWLITFTEHVNLKRISAFRDQIARWDQTLDVRIDQIASDAVRLRLVTIPSVRPHFVDRMVRACRDRVCAPGVIAIRSQ